MMHHGSSVINTDRSNAPFASCKSRVLFFRELRVDSRDEVFISFHCIYRPYIFVLFLMDIRVETLSGGIRLNAIDRPKSAKRLFSLSFAAVVVSFFCNLFPVKYVKGLTNADSE